jgi:virginiamycin B lyase
MKTKKSSMYISRRQAIAGILATGAGLTASFAATPSSFAATLAAFAQNPTPQQLQAAVQTSQVALKKHKLAGKSAKAALKTYTPKTNKLAAPLAAADAKATFTAYPITSTGNPVLGEITRGDDGSSFWFTEEHANRIGKITTQGAITEFLLPNLDPNQEWRPTNIANGPDDSFWFTYPGNTSYIGRMVGATGQLTLYTLPSNFNQNANGITRGPNDTIWFTGKDAVGSLTNDGAMTLFTIPDTYYLSDIATGTDDALWFGVVSTGGTTFGIGHLTTSGDYTFYPIPYRIGDINGGMNNDLWFTETHDNRIGRITTSGQLTQYKIANPASNVKMSLPTTITRLADGTFAFGLRTIVGSEDVDGPTYMGTINQAGNIHLYKMPQQDAPNDSVYAGWANEVWFTTDSKIYKFRLS